MTKKILAGVLAGVSMLSLSAPAFATTNVKESTIAGTNYDVEAGIVFGSVDAVLPATLGTGVNGVRINPYGAAVSTVLEVATAADDAPSALANNSFIASPYYNVKNNDTQNGLKVLASVSVKKATGLVVVDQNAAAPANFYEAVKDATATPTVPVHKEDDDTAYNPLVSYDKITAVKGTDKFTGGAVSAKQAMNIGVSLIGGSDVTELAKLNPQPASAAEGASVVATGAGVAYTDPKNAVEGGTYRVDLLPKGTAGGTLLWLPIAALDDTTDPDDPTVTPTEGYFTVKGDLNPEIDKENYAWNKEALSLNIVLKLIPTYDPAGKPTPAPTTAATATKDIAVTSDGTTPTVAAFDAATATYTVTGVARRDNVTFAPDVKRGFTVTYASTNGTGATGTTATFEAETGTNTMVITITNDTDSTDTTTYTYTFTV